MKGGKASGGTRKADAKLAVKKIATKGKAAKDLNKPKRPSCAFFIFLEEFRKQFKEENPNNKSVAAVSKACGAKWKAMSTSEKAPYVTKADRRKKEYEKNMETYNRKLQTGGGKVEDDESDNSRSEVNDEEEDSEDEGDED